MEKSIMVNFKEAGHAQPKYDFFTKVSIALKEANETGCRLMLLKDTAYISGKEFDGLNNDAEELLKLLVSIVKTTKRSLNR